MEKGKKSGDKLLIITQIADSESRFGFFIGWIKEFAKYYKQVHVLCLQKGTYNLPKNVKVYSMGKEMGYSKIKQIVNFYKLILNLDYNKTFIHMNPIWVLLGFLVWKIKRIEINLWYALKHTPFNLRVANLFVKNLFTSTKESVSIKTPKLRTVGQGIDLENLKISRKPSGKIFKIISASRVSPVKDFLTAINALSLIDFDYEFDIYGEAITKKDKDYLAELSSILEKKNMSKKIKFKGLISHKDLLKLLKNYDLFVNQSRTNSLDKAVLEAMACNMKVLTSNTAFKPVLSEDYKFEHGDFKTMAKKMKNLKETKTKPNFRGIVEKKHSTENLIKKIVHYIQNG